MNSKAPIAALLALLGAAVSASTQAQTTYTEDFTACLLYTSRCV